MSEVVVVATFTVKPEARDEALTGLRNLVSRSLEEEGCVSYALHSVAGKADEMVMLERWRSQADLDAHFQKPYVAEIGPLAGRVCSAPPEIRFCAEL